MNFENIKMMKPINLKDRSELIFTGITVIFDQEIEKRHKLGIAHFWEHLAFKGTETKTEKDIFKAVEDLGGHFNAYTSHTEITFHITGPAEHQLVFEEILMDIVWNSIFPVEEVNKERNAILEEIRLYEDEPMSILFNGAYQALEFMSHPILGTVESVKSITTEDLLLFSREILSQKNSVFPWSSKKWQTPYNIEKSKNVNPGRTRIRTDLNGERISLKKTGLSSSYVAICFPTNGKMHETCEEINMTSSELGSGFSSPMFQRIRNDLGLAYSVGTSIDETGHCGLLIGYCICDEKNVEIAIEEMLKIFEKELDVSERTKNLVKSAIISSNQKVQTRMKRKIQTSRSRKFDYEKFYSIKKTIPMDRKNCLITTLTPEN